MNKEITDLKQQIDELKLENSNKQDYIDKLECGMVSFECAECDALKEQIDELKVIVDNKNNYIDKLRDDSRVAQELYERQMLIIRFQGSPGEPDITKWCKCDTCELWSPKRELKPLANDDNILICMSCQNSYNEIPEGHPPDFPQMAHGNTN